MTDLNPAAGPLADSPAMTSTRHNPDRICRHCAGTGMDSTRHLDVVEDHPCGYCAGSGGAR